MRYLIPGATHRSEEEIRRSRFITTVGYAPAVDAARRFVADVSAEFPDASHHCWAYVVGPPGSTGQVGMSDAGEPHGTAGRPMLTVLLHSGVGDIVAVVTRYFGGTLLGKGGLVKAYSGGVQRTLDSLPLAEHVPKVDLLAVFDYGAMTPLKRILADHEATLTDEEFAADVTVRVQLPAERLAAFQDALMNLTNGQILIEVRPSQR